MQPEHVWSSSKYGQRIIYPFYAKHHMGWTYWIVPDDRDYKVRYGVLHTKHWIAEIQTSETVGQRQWEQAIEQIAVIFGESLDSEQLNWLVGIE